MDRNPALICLTAATPLTASTMVALKSAAAADGDWMLVFPVGEVAPRDGRGPYRLEPEDAADLVNASLAYFGATKIVVDYDHQSIFNGVAAKAAGWIEELEARADGVWARISWTDSAKAAIKADEYRYLSPTFHVDDRNRARFLISVALTNSPALDLAAVAANAQPASTRKDIPMKDLLAALGLAADAKETDAVAAVAALKSRADALTAVAARAGTASDATAESIVSAITAKVADPSRFVPIALHTEVSGELVALKKKLSDDEADAAVTEAICTGKVTPAQKEWATDYARKDITAFKAFAAAAPVVAAPQKAAPPKAAGVADGGSGMTPQQLQTKAAALRAERAKLGIHINISDAVTLVAEGRADAA